MVSHFFTFIILLMSFATSAGAKDINEYRCGFAIGYPPYQYVNNGSAEGIDVDVAKLVFKTAGLKVSFIPGEWDELLSNLVHRTQNIDMLCGAEISDKRKALLDFSEPYYLRHIVLFTLKKSPITKVSDLYGKLITGDKDSFFEKHLGAKKDDIRVMQTISKEESFQKLKDGSVVAVIAPVEVGFFVAKKLNIEVKTLGEKDPGSPVAIAVSKGNKRLLDIINESLKKIKKNGQLNKVLAKHLQKN